MVANCDHLAKPSFSWMLLHAFIETGSSGVSVPIETLTVIKGLWPFMRAVPAFVARWYFPPEKLARLIYVDLFPRNDSAMLDLGHSAVLRVHLQIINLSPYAVVLDQANFNFRVGVVGVKAIVVKKQRIEAGEIASLFLEEAIADGHAKQMLLHYGMNSKTLEGNMEFSCALHPFSKTVGQLSGVQVKLVNEHLRAVV